MAQEDPHYFDDYCSAFWVDPKGSLSFEFDFPFVCGDENGYIDFGQGQHYYTVSGTDRSDIIDQIKNDFSKEMDQITTGTWWNDWKEIKVSYISGQDFISSMENGHCSVLISYK